MEFILYRNNDAENVVNKTLVSAINLDITLRGDVDINAPSVILTKPSDRDLFLYNYAYIPNLGKFYFVRNWDAINSKMVKLELELDYLETYKGFINMNAKYQRKIQVGDYGDVELSSSGKSNVSEYVSDVELEPSTKAILSVLNSGE